MTRQETIDHVIRSALRTEVRTEEPSAMVRESLLAAASESAVRSALGPTVPPLAEGLQDKSDLILDCSAQTVTTIPLARKQLLLLAAPMYAVR